MTFFLAFCGAVVAVAGSFALLFAAARAAVRGVKRRYPDTLEPTAPDGGYYQ